jgi:uncharacterized membrane protein
VRSGAIGEQGAVKTSRYWELDALRGTAIVLMIGFHLSWDLTFLGLFDLMSTGPWPWFSRIIATMFLLALGISLTLSYARAGRSRGFRKYLLRGLKIVGWGMVITLVTYFFLGRGFVVFGVLHMLGFSIIAAYPFLPYRRRYVSLLAGIALIAVGIRVNRLRSPTPWLLPLGVLQIGRPMADYYPILPWFGVALVSVWIGHTLYPGGRPRYALPDWSGAPAIRQLCTLGRHSLLIYLVHQPLLLGVLYGIEALLR